MPTLLTTGGTGLVLSRFLELYHEVYHITDINTDIDGMKEGVVYKKIDLLDKKEIKRIIQEVHPSYIIHAAAYTDVAGAEKQKGEGERSIAWQINVEGTKHILDAIKGTDIHFIFISTDFVFDGKNGPYEETTETATSAGLISWYGWTKREAEEMIRTSGIAYTIIRISYPYRKSFTGKMDFIQKMISMIEHNTLYPMFDDQQITPSYIDDTSRGLKLIIDKNLQGIYHIASPELTSPYKVACKVVEAYKTKHPECRVAVQRSSIHEYLKQDITRPRVPINGGLVSAKIEKEGLKLHSITEGINDILS